MGFFDDMPAKAPVTPSAPIAAAAPPSIGVSLDKVAATAPAMVDLSKKARVSLEKKGITRAMAVYGVLDYSLSMTRFYRSGFVQTLTERILALSTGLDNDGIVPVILFDSVAHPAVDVSLSDYQGAVQRCMTAAGKMGGTEYHLAIDAVVAHYVASGTTDPAFVVFQTDGKTRNEAATKRSLIAASAYPIFFSFVGIGTDPFTFLHKLDDLDGRVVDNASFFAAGDGTMDASVLYDNLVEEVPQWLLDIRAANIG